MTAQRLSTGLLVGGLFAALVVLGPAGGITLAAPNWDVSEVDGDGIDNDGDGYTDSEDTECGSYYEGFGSVSVGGAGGTVFWVDPNLADPSSPGSDPHSGTHADPCTLRKALDGSNRVIKFISAGTHTLTKTVIIRGSNLTIDGFTCPSPGVTITHTTSYGSLTIAPFGGQHGHDFIFNHLRLDSLYDIYPTPGGSAMLGVDGDVSSNEVSEVIFDHLTIRDQRTKCSLWGKVENVTVSNCLFHSNNKSLLISFYGLPYDLLRNNFSLSHNVFAESDERNPQLRGWIRNLDIVNNVMYHWGVTQGWGYGIRIKNEPGEESIFANVINNYFVASILPSSALIYGINPGRDSRDNGPPTCLNQGDIYASSDMGDLWVAGNILPPANCDEYSTIPGPLSIPAWAQVTTIPADQLYTTVPQVGMQYKDVRDQGVIDRVLAAIGPDVYGRYVFYNNSAFDGNDPTANASDDAAIAPDKTALLPGGTAAFANYTSYASGINGIMIDIPSLPGTPAVADFAFKVGNDNNPAGWSAGPAPSSVTIRPGAGAGGSDRVTIIWADNAIEKQWLQVTVLATGNTGLSSPDVFYFANAIGETGNSPSDAEVTPTDEIGVRNNPHTLGQNPATITDAYDFNRDRKVGPTDAVICRNNGTSSPTALKLINVP